MKTCPRCQKTYADDNLNFCLDDGSPLTGASNVAAPTTAFERPTVVRADESFGVSNPQSGWTQAPAQFGSVPVQKSSKMWAVAIGILGILILVCGGGAIGGLLIFGPKSSNIKNTPVVNSFSPSPSPSFSARNSTASPSPAATSYNGASLLKTGTYSGSVRNATYNESGDLVLRIDSVDSYGSVKAYFEASHGLTGHATMSGRITAAGEMTLSGKLPDGRALAVNSTVKGENISGGYGIAGGGLKGENGTFSVNRR
jgi:hypothetical protein